MSKITALARHLNVSEETIAECRYDSDTYESTDEPGEYRVLTDAEADSAWDDYIEECIEKFILPEVQQTIRKYFEAWKRVDRADGDRGHSLASYDGREHEVKVDGNWFYIYRTN